MLGLVKCNSLKRKKKVSINKLKPLVQLLHLEIQVTTDAKSSLNYTWQIKLTVLTEPIHVGSVQRCVTDNKTTAGHSCN